MHMFELVEKKSKFIGYVFGVQSTDEVKAILDGLKKEHKKATPITYAYSLKTPFLEKAFDDGEPSGTAGKPILYVLQKNKKENTLLVVVRYFGGIKLGAGGLLRAYSKTASECIKLDFDN